MTSHHITSYHIISYHIISYHITSYHIISYHIISYHIISHHITSYHITSYHIISHHITSYHCSTDELQPPIEGYGANSLGGVIKHRHLPMFFTKYNNETKRYGVLPKQLFCFPSNKSEFDTASYLSDSGSGLVSDIDVDSDENSKHQSNITQQKAFKHAEVLLLDLYSFLKSSYSRTNCQSYSNGNESSDDSNSVLPKIDRQKLNDTNISGVSDGNIKANNSTNTNTDTDSNSIGTTWGQEMLQSVDDKTETETQIQIPDLVMADLFTLLKMSGRRDVAVVFESTIWHAWMAHHDPQVNKAMRLGISNLVRNDVIAAHDNFMEATLRDPFYPEAHNKLAAMYHKAGTGDHS